MTYYWKDRERALAYVRAGATAAAAAALILKCVKISDTMPPGNPLS